MVMNLKAVSTEEKYVRNVQESFRCVKLTVTFYFRYSWNGEPLLMTSQGPGSIPPCSACGGKRVFELQLMPALVSLLRIEGRDKRMTSCDNQAMNEKSTKGGGQDDADLYRNWSSESIEFGTVFVYTCSQGCWSEDEQYREEYVVVYSDPDQHRFKNAK